MNQQKNVKVLNNAPTISAFSLVRFAIYRQFTQGKMAWFCIARTPQLPIRVWRR